MSGNKGDCVGQIPFKRSCVVGEEVMYIREAISKGQIAGGHVFSNRSQDLLEHVLGIKRALLTTSCTHSLEMSAMLLDIDPDAEVIVPSFTFVSTANAFATRGARVIYADIRPDTLNLDETKLDALITDRTRAVVPVHYAGVACEMDRICEVASRRGIAVIEDNAHGLFGKYKGKWLGTFGCLATQSFHETKNITCGEGGALLINDPRFVERAEIIREKGTNRGRFFRGQVDKYTWVDLGSSYVMSDLLAAFLYGQLEQWPSIQVKRMRIWETYCEALADWAVSQGVRLPVIPEHCEQAYHMFYLLLPDLESRQRLIAHLKQLDICAVFHYLPLHLSEYGARWGGAVGDCPVTEDISDRLLRLPFYNSFEREDQLRVISAIRDFKC